MQWIKLYFYMFSTVDGLKWHMMITLLLSLYICNLLISRLCVTNLFCGNLWQTSVWVTSWAAVAAAVTTATTVAERQVACPTNCVWRSVAVQRTPLQNYSITTNTDQKSTSGACKLHTAIISTSCWQWCKQDHILKTKTAGSKQRPLADLTLK